jgi:hypothetical protein
MLQILGVVVAFIFPKRLGRTHFLHCLLCLTPTLPLAHIEPEGRIELWEAVLGELLLFVLSELDRHSNSISYGSHSPKGFVGWPHGISTRLDLLAGVHRTLFGIPRINDPIQRRGSASVGVRPQINGAISSISMYRNINGIVP